MNLLILGNGFDLAHSLKTTYKNFLDQCSDVKIYKKIDNSIFRYIDENMWIEYFIKIFSRKLCGDNWIDFENEILLIIHNFDCKVENINNLIYQNAAVAQENKFTEENNNEKLEIFIHYLMELDKTIFTTKSTFDDLRKRLFEDLQRLILALEIYLCEQEKSLDIGNTPTIVKDINPNNIITFNYTNTAEKVFSNVNICYIHGKCKEGYNIDNNNMIIGIDEYWNDDRKNTHMNYAIFRKFVQRIQKKTDTQYLKIIPNQSEKTNIYVFGHSLDISDKDILNMLFTNINVQKITIYCRGEIEQGRLISNSIKIVGQDKFREMIDNNIFDFVLI